MNSSKSTLVRSALTSVVVIGLSTALSGCFLTAKNSTPSAPAPQYGMQGAGTVGIRNVNSLLPSMMAVTKLSPTAMVPNSNQSFAAAYNNIAPFVSANGSVAGVNSAMLLSITGFAGNVCQAWLMNEASAEAAKAGSSMANAGVSFSAGPAGITPAIAATVAKNYATLFWGRAPTAAELQILVQAITGAQAAVTASGSAGTQNVLLVPCTAALASPAFLAS